MTDMASDRQPWHLDKRIPLALIGAVLIQTGGAFWYASSINERVSSLESWRTDSKTVATDIADIKATMRSLDKSIDDLNRRLRDGKMNYERFDYRERPVE